MKKTFFIVLIFFFVGTAFGQSYSTRITYTATTANTRTSETAAGFDVTCHGRYLDLSAHEKGTHPLSVTTPLITDDSCRLFWNLAYSYDRNWQWQKAYDTGRKVIETCPNYSQAREAFDFTDDGIQQMNSNDTSRFRNYRQWLISVLFLNTTDPDYFCRCILSISGTYMFSEHGRFPNANISIGKWMIDHHYCPTYPKWDVLDSEGFAANRFEWIDSGDSAKGKPFDSTLNTMHQLGLDFLDSLKFGVHSQKAPSSTYLSSLTVLPNPSHGLVTANYALARQSFVQFTVYDALGRVIWSRAGESEIEGMHELPIDLRSSPSGTYYVRIEAGFGEVKTVKLVHQK